MGVKQTLFVVQAGEGVVKWDRFRSVIPTPLEEGIHLRIPFIQKLYMYDIKIKPREISTRSGTKDQQQVNIKLRVLHRPKVESLPWLFENWGMDYEEKIMPSIGNEILKAVMAQFNAEELITKRHDVSKMIREKMKAKEQEFGMVFEDISLMDIKFGSEFMQAVESKQVAQQDVDRHKYIVLKSEQERQAAVVRAEGEAESAQLISDAIVKYGSGMIQLRRIEASREIARNLAGSGNVTYLPGGANMLMQLDPTARPAQIVPQNQGRR